MVDKLRPSETHILTQAMSAFWVSPCWGHLLLRLLSSRAECLLLPPYGDPEIGYLSQLIGEYEVFYLDPSDNLAQCHYGVMQYISIWFIICTGIPRFKYTQFTYTHE